MVKTDGQCLGVGANDYAPIWAKIETSVLAGWDTHQCVIYWIIPQFAVICGESREIVWKVLSASGDFDLMFSQTIHLPAQ